jgi:hypothetical protein
MRAIHPAEIFSWERGRSVDFRNRLVNFRIADVYHPESQELLQRMFGKTVLQGSVREVTGRPGDPDRYLVVQLRDFPEPVIVMERSVLGVL